jgi:hypothetical protein
MQRLDLRGETPTPVAISIILIVILLSAGLFWFLLHSSNSGNQAMKTTAPGNACVGQQFTDGSSGHCVRDIQTLVNYMEHSGLTECPFSGGATLSVTGAFNSATAAQVKSVQQWSSCYAHQEGFTSNVHATGTIDRTTWGELCTYGYTDPLHTSATGAKDSIAAGKDAGCAELQS